MRAFDVPLPTRGGGTIHALDFGPGDRCFDIVFLHANGFNALTYRSILAPLADDFRILALDQRGHGHTTLATVSEGRRDWLDLRDDLLAVMAELQIGGAVLSGHSMGATVAILAAAAAPPIARALVLFDPVFAPRERVADAPHSAMVQGALRRRSTFASREEAMTSYAGRGAFRSWTAEMLADYLRDGLRETHSGQVTLTCTPEWEASGYAAHEHDTEAALRALRRPTTIYKAEHDSTFRLDPGFASAPTGARIVVVPGTSHFLPMERPELVSEALRAAEAKA